MVIETSPETPLSLRYIGAVWNVNQNLILGICGGECRCTELEPGRVRSTLNNTLKELQLDYLDLYLVIQARPLYSMS